MSFSSCSSYGLRPGGSFSRSVGGKRKAMCAACSDAGTGCSATGAGPASGCGTARSSSIGQMGISSTTASAFGLGVPLGLQIRAPRLPTAAARIFSSRLGLLAPALGLARFLTRGQPSPRHAPWHAPASACRFAFTPLAPASGCGAAAQRDRPGEPARQLRHRERRDQVDETSKAVTVTISAPVRLKSCDQPVATTRPSDAADANGAAEQRPSSRSAKAPPHRLAISMRVPAIFDHRSLLDPRNGPTARPAPKCSSGKRKAATPKI